GLGAGHFNPNETANTALVRDESGNSGGVQSSHAGGFSITQHTWQQVVMESNPLVAIRGGGLTQAQYDAAVVAWRSNVITAAAPPGLCNRLAVTDGGTTCYYGVFTPLISWNPFDPVELLPPGVFAVYGVPFGAYEITEGKFIRTTVPTSVQRRQLEWAV